jgi:dynein assembly factor with WDR repeat domains 1
MAFNVPFGDRVATGSFDKTAKIWDTNTGELFSTLKGHKMEIVCL